MRIERDLLTSLGVTSARADRYLDDLNRELPRHGIDSPLRVAHFLAQVLHESGRMRVVEENLNYSAERLLEIFPHRFTPEEAQSFARDPERIGNRVYGGRLGNGPEASGDGFRYRGRGLIQLTGRTNYRRFSEWVGDDVVAQPDLVAGRYAVHSSVFYWDSSQLNAVADLDDVKRVTQVVNGGLNGLEDRMRLLEGAKAALELTGPPPVLESATHRVTAVELNLRSRPEVSRSTRIGSLHQGTEVAKLRDADIAPWVEIRTLLNGRITQGFVSSSFLEAIPPAVISPRPMGFEVPPVHLEENRRDITRQRDGGRAYPLGEAGMPRRTGAEPAAKVRQLREIIDFLDSESSDHRRYWPKGGTTFCNIYAHDYCYLAGAFFPRVWWTDRALRRIQGGEEVEVHYGETVRELNANALHDWLLDHGRAFGWQRELHLEVLQAAANNGELCLIVAQNKDLNRSGHVSAVVAEQDGFEAARGPAGEVKRPVESQAGRTNHRLVTKRTAWWLGARFRFSFWRHG